MSMVRTMIITISCMLAMSGMRAVLGLIMSWQVVEKELLTSSTFNGKGLGDGET